MMLCGWGGQPAGPASGRRIYSAPHRGSATDQDVHGGPGASVTDREYAARNAALQRGNKRHDGGALTGRSVYQRAAVGRDVVGDQLAEKGPAGRDVDGVAAGVTPSQMLPGPTSPSSCSSSPMRAGAARWASELADLQGFSESRRGDSNPGPPPYHGGALPAELRRRYGDSLRPSGGSRIRTCVGSADRFTAGLLWPLGHPPGRIRRRL
jgi:hypothetical protein